MFGTYYSEHSRFGSSISVWIPSSVAIVESVGAVFLLWIPNTATMADRTVTVYTREECHLCEDAKATIEAVADSIPQSVEIEEVDVDDDESLREEYGDRVPYVLVDGRPAFKYRVDERELRRKLEF